MKIGLQMLFKLMPALLKCDVGTFALDAILDVLLSIIFGAILDPFLDPFLDPAGDAICLYMGVFWIWGVGPDLFLTHFWTVL